MNKLLLQCLCLASFLLAYNTPLFCDIYVFVPHSNKKNSDCSSLEAGIKKTISQMQNSTYFKYKHKYSRKLQFRSLEQQAMLEAYHLLESIIGHMLSSKKSQPIHMIGWGNGISIINMLSQLLDPSISSPAVYLSQPTHKKSSKSKTYQAQKKMVANLIDSFSRLTIQSSNFITSVINVYRPIAPYILTSTNVIKNYYVLYSQVKQLQSAFNSTPLTNTHNIQNCDDYLLQVPLMRHGHNIALSLEKKVASTKKKEFVIKHIGSLIPHMNCFLEKAKIKTPATNHWSLKAYLCQSDQVSITPIKDSKTIAPHSAKDNLTNSKNSANLVDNSGKHCKKHYRKSTMAIQAGLVGLPNVGKSTLFNALTKSQIPAENFPFCTVDPNKAITYVPDQRLEKLAKIFDSQKIIPTNVTFVDIAGLVKGASAGEGLGNQFLGHIMDVDLVLHVLRCFESSDITHVHDNVDPLDDFETICAELMLKDLDSVNKRIEKIKSLQKTARNKNVSPQQIKEWEQELEAYDTISQALNQGKLDSVQKHVKNAKDEGINLIHLISGKNFLIIANLSEDDYTGENFKENKHFQALIEKFGPDKVIPVSAKIEAELAQLPEEEAREMMESLEITHKGLDDIIKKAYDNLGLITFFTCGPKEAHAWSLKKDTPVPQAAGEIHTDLQRGFIRADVYNCDDIFAAGTEAELKNQGKIRMEGKEYIVQDGDLLNIRFNV